LANTTPDQKTGELKTPVSLGEEFFDEPSHFVNP
jgi:hypothetical protein